jgi:hypothetical protein
MAAKRVTASPTPSHDKDDVRQAASLAVGIAGSVATAALAVLAVLGAVVTYVAANYEGLTLFYVLAGVAAILIIGAVYLGIAGIAEITNKGYQGTWSPWTKNHLFDKQAFAALAGILVLGAAIVIGFTSAPKSSTAQPAVAPNQTSEALRQTVLLEQRVTETDRVLVQILRHDHAGALRTKWPGKRRWR